MSRQALIPAVLLLAGGLFSAGCESTSGDFMPLEVGNVWEYEVLGPSGPAAPQARTDVIEIFDRIDHRRVRVRELALTTVWSKELGYLLRSDGSAREPLLALPPHTGYRWPLKTPGGRLYYEIVGRETVTVPAGTFAGCVKVVQRDASGKRVVKRWFAPDVGLVRDVTVYSGRAVETKSLRRYRVRLADGSRRTGSAESEPGPEPAP